MFTIPHVSNSDLVAKGSASDNPVGQKRMSKVEEVMKKEQESRQRELESQAAKTRVDNWLLPGIVVKVMSKELIEHGYYKLKVRVTFSLLA
jgi:DNA/RNA-binding protein KIN17